MNNPPKINSHLRLAPTPEEQRRDRRKEQFRTTGKWMGVIAATSALSFAAVRGVQYMNNDADVARAQARLTFATDPRFNDVAALRQHGACADELLEEASFADAKAAASKNDSNRRNNATAADRFRKSAQLAAAHDIGCAPQELGATSLTPNFDVPKLQAARYCSQEILSDVVDPSALKGSAIRENAALNNEILHGLAALASTYQVACE